MKHRGPVTEPDWLFDPEAYAARGRVRKPRPPEDDDTDSNPYGDDWGTYRIDPGRARVKWIDKVGQRSGGRYNTVLVIRGSTPQKVDHEIQKFLEMHHGAKKIIEVVKKTREGGKNPHVGLVFVLDRHKHGFEQAFAESAKTTRQILEGIQSSKPQIYQSYRQWDWETLQGAAKKVADRNHLDAPLSQLIEETFTVLRQAANTQAKSRAIMEQWGTTDPRDLEYIQYTAERLNEAADAQQRATRNNR